MIGEWSGLKKSHFSYSQEFNFVGPGLTRSNSRKNWLVKQKLKIVAVEVVDNHRDEQQVWTQ